MPLRYVYSAYYFLSMRDCIFCFIYVVWMRMAALPLLIFMGQRVLPTSELLLNYFCNFGH